MRPPILIVDDDTEVAETCARVLRTSGFDCLVAHDGPAALTLFDAWEPALVLADINLPTSDGLEIARYIRRKSPGTPIVLMSTGINSKLPGMAAGAGAARYLSKPFSNAELISTIRSLLDASPGTAAAPSPASNNRR